jgi:hypothetical protein
MALWWLAGVEEEFPVAFGAGEARGKDVEDLEAGVGGAGFDGSDRFFVESRVDDNTAFGNIRGWEFELRLDEDEEVGMGSGARQRAGQNFADGDEREVGGDEVGALGNVAWRKIARVAFHGDDERILLESPGKLMDVDVDGEDEFGAVLEKAISEAAGGGADVEASAARGIEGKIGESGFEFAAGAGSEFLASDELETGVGRDGCAGFVGAGTVNANLAREDEGLGFLLGIGEAASDERLIEAEAGGFFHGIGRRGAERRREEIRRPGKRKKRRGRRDGLEDGHDMSCP